MGLGEHVNSVSTEGHVKSGVMVLSGHVRSMTVFLISGVTVLRLKDGVF